MSILLGKHSKMNKQELEAEGSNIANEIISIANEIDPYSSIPEIADVIDVLKIKIDDFESASHHWYLLDRKGITSATETNSQKLYKISYAFSDLDSEGIPSFYDDVDYLYAYSEEDAEKKFEENLREDYGVDEHGHIPGYEGCDVNEATPEEIEKHEFWNKNTDRRDEAIAYVTKKVRELGIPESQVSDYVDDCVEVLEDYYAFDDIPEWIDAGYDASYWVDWETRNLFENGFPDNIIEEICSGATTIEDEESTVYL